jgi:hypothetical protein
MPTASTTNTKAKPRFNQARTTKIAHRFSGGGRLFAVYVVPLFRPPALGQHSAGTFTRNFAQGIIDSFRLTERDDGGISQHGVSLLSGGSGRLDTRLDTPPSTKRRHPDSRIALLAAASSSPDSFMQRLRCCK